jgi:predicted transcriptional regulator
MAINEFAMAKPNDEKQEKRDQLDLLLDMLKETKEPVKKTHILYRTRINYYQLSRYLNLLLKLNMVEEVTNPLEGFRITDKGGTMLSLFLVS